MEAGMQSLIEAALQQGIWAALYIYLFFRMLKENKGKTAIRRWLTACLATLRKESKISRAGLTRWKNVETMLDEHLYKTEGRAWPSFFALT